MNDQDRLELADIKKRAEEARNLTVGQAQWAEDVLHLIGWLEEAQR